MAVRTNKALAKLRAGGVVSGPMVVYASPDLVERVAQFGFDYVWIDAQHGEFTELTQNQAIARCRASGTTPLVRVKGNERGSINRALDMGAMALVVPMVESAAEARAVVDAAYYPPRGHRSAGGVRLGLLADGDEDYWFNANAEIMTVVMVETEAAIGKVREIMRVPGVDVVLIGPGDLMIDVKSRGDAAKHESLVLEVAAASKETGTAAGYVCMTEEVAARRIAQGFRFLNWGLDHFMLMDGMKALRAATAKLAP